MLIAITAYASDYGVICLKHTVTYFLFLVNHHHSQVNNNPAQRLQTILYVYLSLRNSQKLIFQFGVTRNVVTFIDPIEIENREEGIRMVREQKGSGLKKEVHSQLAL